jgi:anti-sigma regulatory factor (Ser/Thr protein kinase)
VPEVRASVRHLAVDAGLETPSIEDLALAVTEAAANVVRHAYPRGADGVFDLDASIDDGDVVVRLRDYGLGIRPYARSGGLGIGVHLMHELCDGCSITACAPGTLVTLRFAVMEPRP